MNMFSSQLVVIVIVLFFVDVILADVATFTPIEFDYDDSKISGVTIDLSSDGGSGPNTTMFTIFPSNEGDGVTVETSPANLVTIPKSTYDLSFEWNTDVSSTATSGGVRIGIPSDRLKTIDVEGGHNAQILDGFTNIYLLNVWGDGSIIRASMMSLLDSTTPSLKLRNSGGRMYVKTNMPVTGESTFTGGSQSWVETPSFTFIHVGNSFNYINLGNEEGTQLNIKGDIDLRDSYDGNVYMGGQLTVTGTITGTIYNEDNSTVNAPSCDNVISSDGSGTCNAGQQIVDVDVCDLSQKSPDFGGEVSAASVRMPGYFFATIAVAVVVTVVTATTLI